MHAERATEQARDAQYRHRSPGMTSGRAALETWPVTVVRLSRGNRPQWFQNGASRTSSLLSSVAGWFKVQTLSQLQRSRHGQMRDRASAFSYVGACQVLMGF